MIEDDKNEESCFSFFSLTIRETSEGWPLLFVETEEDLWSTNERGHSLVGSLG
jgi:hypothetical protein